MKLDKTHIPEEPYCYTWLETPSEKNGFKGKTHKCPYYTHKTLNGVKVAWCEFMDLGGILNEGKDDDYEKLTEHYGTEEKVSENLPLFLLFDYVKECGEKDNWE